MKGIIVAAVVLLGASWSAPASAAPVGKNCLDLMRRGYPSLAFYEIEPQAGQVFTVWCEGDRDYLPLCKTTGDNNFGQYTVGGAVSGTTVRTSYTRVRIDPQTLVIDVADMTFATSSGGVSGANNASTMALGSAYDCAGMGSQSGRANINLTGTPFTISKTLWFAAGYGQAGSVSVDGKATQQLPPTGMLSVTGKSVTVTGGGFCGGAGPYGIYTTGYNWYDRNGFLPSVRLAYTGAQTCTP
jgi:hypothetical protein